MRISACILDFRDGPEPVPLETVTASKHDTRTLYESQTAFAHRSARCCIAGAGAGRFAQAPAGRGGGAPQISGELARAPGAIAASRSASSRRRRRPSGSAPATSRASARTTQLTKGENGVWEVTVGPVDPGTYRYNFNVDGVADDRPAQPVHQRVEQQRLEPRPRARAPTSPTRRTCRTAASRR